MKVLEPKIIHHMNDVIKGEKVEYSEKRYQDVKYLYKHQREDNPIVYTVYSYSEGKDVLGNLNYGLTILKPVYSQGECNMTKGHFHNNKDCAEFYLGISGTGLLLLMDGKGNTWAEKVFEGSVHYIDGKLAHRLINVGETDLKVGACWPTSAGHDYVSIKNNEFKYRVFKTNEDIQFIKDR